MPCRPFVRRKCDFPTRPGARISKCFWNTLEPSTHTSPIHLFRLYPTYTFSVFLSLPLALPLYQLSMHWKKKKNNWCKWRTSIYKWFIFSPYVHSNFIKLPFVFTLSLARACLSHITTGLKANGVWSKWKVHIHRRLKKERQSGERWVYARPNATTIHSSGAQSRPTEHMKNNKKKKKRTEK